MKTTLSARRLLLPLVPLYRSALALREFRLRTGMEPIRRLRFPVVSIGNLSTGGSGKTPLTIALARLLTGKGLRTDVLSRGYGRQSRAVARVNSAGNAEEFGDEPLLIAREAEVPVYVAPKRFDAGLLAESDLHTAPGKDKFPIVHLLDDGFQHRQLARDVDVLVLDRRDWQEWLLPAGSLREPIRAASRASVIAIPIDEPALEDELRTSGWQGPIWRLRRRMDVPEVDGPVAAFCGIARPEQFFAGLETAKLSLVARIVFPDHHTYTHRDIGKLASHARSAGAFALVTTDKDLIRMGKLADALPEASPLKTAHLRIEIEDQDAAIDWLLGKVGATLARPRV